MNALTLADLHGGLVVDGSSSHTLFDLSGHSQECLFDVGGALGGCFQEWDSQAIRKFLKHKLSARSAVCFFLVIITHLSHRVFDDLLVLHITLVADQKLVNTFSSIAINLLQPLLDVVERVHVGHIVDNADTVCSSVVRRCDCSESFLTGSIPL